MKELVALLDNREVGVVVFDRSRLTFVYADDWRSAPGAYPLSLSMPLAAKEHSHAAIEPFLWGLLPDNEFILGRWAQKFQVSPRNPFALIANVGEDCAGAVQFVTRDRIGELLTAPPAPTAWVDEKDIAERLRALKADASAWRQPQDAGQFSLAGAQPKTTLLFDGARWGVPSGRTPTTHILKPPVGGLDGHAENEHLCLALARALGMPAARSEVRLFDGEAAIVIERYDRVNTVALAASRAALAAAKSAEAAAATDAAGASAAAEAVDVAASAAALHEFYRTTPVYRVHQEDFCQALRVHPSKKYQNDGGPGPKDIVDLLRSNAAAPQKARTAGRDAADEDAGTFLDALIFNWLIAGTDAHAKNYSVLIGGRGLVRLAPLYDIASILPYDDIDPRKAKLAMKVGDEYRLHHIGLPEWRKLAIAVKTDPEAMIARVRDMAGRLPDLAADEARRARSDGLLHPIVSKLIDALAVRAKKFAAT